MISRISQVKSIQSIISESSNAIVTILINWKKIVGGNSKIMMPSELKRGVLEIAVPNNIVLSTVSKFTDFIIGKTNAVLNQKIVKKLKFVVKPSCFSREKAPKNSNSSSVKNFSKEEIELKKKELVQKFNLDKDIAETAAEIELIVKTKQKSEVKNE